jgi:hypothetical protein
VIAGKREIKTGRNRNDIKQVAGSNSIVSSDNDSRTEFSIPAGISYFRPDNSA